MAIKQSVEPIIKFIKKNKYVVLIFAVGVLLMTVPSVSDASGNDATPSDVVVQPTETIEQRLEKILSRISGAGNVSVMLTEKTGEETVFQNNNKRDERTDAIETDIETVIITNQDRSEFGLIRQINPPDYLGAIIVCQGADDPKVRLAITDAVSKITGLGANQISVLKMK